MLFRSNPACIIGGKPLKQAGFFYPATILTDVTKDMEAYKEELFGPVAIIIKAKSNDEAINIANDSLYGLGAAIFSNDIKKAESIAKKELQAGTCCVNTLVKSDPKFAFGGIKQSGYGRELGKFGMHEFVNIKTVHVYKP